MFLRHAPGDPLLRMHKRLTRGAIVGGYRMMRAMRVGLP